MYSFFRFKMMMLCSIWINWKHSTLTTFCFLFRSFTHFLSWSFNSMQKHFQIMSSWKIFDNHHSNFNNLKIWLLMRQWLSKNSLQNVSIVHNRIYSKIRLTSQRLSMTTNVERKLKMMILMSSTMKCVHSFLSMRNDRWMYINSYQTRFQLINIKIEVTVNWKLIKSFHSISFDCVYKVFVQNYHTSRCIFEILIENYRKLQIITAESAW